MAFGRISMELRSVWPASLQRRYEENETRVSQDSKNRTQFLLAPAINYVNTASARRWSAFLQFRSSFAILWLIVSDLSLNELCESFCKQFADKIISFRRIVHWITPQFVSLFLRKVSVRNRSVEIKSVTGFYQPPSAHLKYIQLTSPCLYASKLTC